MSQPGGRRPKIFLDGYNLGLEQGTGVATYARNLSFRLGALGAEVGVLYGRRGSPSLDPLIREIAFFDGRVGHSPLPLRAARDLRRLLLGPFGAPAVQVPVSGKVITRTFESRLPHFDHLLNSTDLFSVSANHFKWWGGRRLSVEMPLRPDVMHWTYPLALRIPRAKNIYTLHDLVPLRLPYTTLDIKRRYYKLNRMLAQRADHIVTVSENSRRDIINLLGADPERVTNTYQSVEIPRRFAEQPLDLAQDEVRGSFGLEWQRYLLFFGAIEPKKNVGRLIEAYLASGVEDPLVIVGKQAWKSEEELKLLYEDHLIPRSADKSSAMMLRRLPDRVMMFDYAPFRLLVSLIRGAKFVLFPSLYEGFGLPALEAMLLGTPVLTSDTSSLPEVVGEAALKIDPYDVRAIVEGIRALDRDAELRGRLALAGPKQAAQFGPEPSARRLADMYRRLGVEFPA